MGTGDARFRAVGDFEIFQMDEIPGCLCEMICSRKLTGGDLFVKLCDISRGSTVLSECIEVASHMKIKLQEEKVLII